MEKLINFNSIVIRLISVLEVEPCSLHVTISVFKLSISPAIKSLNYDQYSTEVTLLTAEISKCDKGIKACEKAKTQCNKIIQESSLESRKLQHKLKLWEKDCKDAVRTVSMMEKQYPWIETDRQHFGVVGSDYDFTTYGADIKASRQKLHTLKAEQVNCIFIHVILSFVYICMWLILLFNVSKT